MVVAAMGPSGHTTHEGDAEYVEFRDVHNETLSLGSSYFTFTPFRKYCVIY
jgi:hypothetical protein